MIVLGLLTSLVMIIIAGVRRSFVVIILMSMMLLGVILSIRAYEERLSQISVFANTYSDGARSVFSGSIDKKLYSGELSDAYRLNIDNIDNTSPSYRHGTRERYSILVEIPNNLSITIGDTISFTGKPNLMFSGAIDGFEKFIFLHSIAGRVTISNFTLEQRGSQGILDSSALWMQKHIYKGFPRDTAGIILGMTIGDTSLMGKEVQESFRASGISHILVVSGSNITFLIILVSGILKYLPLSRTMRITLIIIFVLGYSTLVGWDTPVIRSSIMGILGFLAIEYTHRLSSAAILLGIANIYLFISPLSLLYDPSFGLSFAATASIILLYSRTQQVFDTWGIPRWLGSILAITCVASIGTIPVTVYHFGSISYGFFLANIAIALVVGWILFCTVFYGILGVFGESVLYVFGLCIYIPVEYILSIARFFGAWGYWDIPHDIRLPFIIIFLAFLCVQFFKIENLDALRVKKEYDHQH